MAWGRRPSSFLLWLVAAAVLLGLFPQAAFAATGRAARATTGAWTYVPVLMYHYIRVNPDPRDTTGYALSVTPAAFHAQMAYLARNQYHTVTLAQAVAAIRANRVLPPRSVVLTFDDGYVDFFSTAIPEMKRYGFTATDFIIPGRVGQPSFMTWLQVIRADMMGFTMGAHTMHHVPLAGISPNSALAEMVQSKRSLEGMLRHRVIEFAYPYGSFNTFIAQQARLMGFESAASTLPGAWHQAGDLWWLHRQRVGGSTTLAGFAQLVGGPRP